MSGKATVLAAFARCDGGNSGLVPRRLFQILDPDGAMPRLCDTLFPGSDQVPYVKLVDFLYEDGPSAALPDAGADELRSATAPAAQQEAKLINGQAIANSITEDVRQAVAELGVSPQLAVVLVGSNPASLSYIKRKEVAATKCGIRTKLLQLDEDVTQHQLAGSVESLDADDDVDGIIIQLPLPEHLNAKAASSSISLVKDVDGFLPANVGATALHGHEPSSCPCTPQGCLALIKSVGTPLRGKEACVLGASNIVGIPMGALLLKEGMTVTTCHIDTADPASHCRRADVLVVAVGKAALVTADWIKPGAIVIDVGINAVPDASKKSGQRLVGDVDASASRVAGFLTPVPGGVGPMTVAMLMRNTLEACRSRRFTRETSPQKQKL